MDSGESSSRVSALLTSTAPLGASSSAASLSSSQRQQQHQRHITHSSNNETHHNLSNQTNFRAANSNNVSINNNNNNNNNGYEARHTKPVSSLSFVNGVVDANAAETLDTHHYEKQRTYQSLRKVNWYWGSITPDYTAKVLESEPEGAFIIRDSSSDYYIFSMSFKFHGKICHSRIQYSKGFYTFNQCAQFRSKNFVEFIEQVIASSYTGDWCFFLHRDPSDEGPARLRLVPVSRFRSGSLKHICRFSILPYVKRDRIIELGLPTALTEYLNEPLMPSASSDP